MRGYWGRPDLDREVFERRSVGDGIEDTFFRTGDLVRQDEDGVFGFLGRGDRQIKTRGYRIELDEVEAALMRHPAVRQAAAYPVPDEHGSVLIAASAVVEGAGDAPTVDDLLDHLRGALPSYAVPARLELRHDLPRTSTGKVDRVRLAAKAGARGVSPRSATGRGEGAPGRAGGSGVAP